MKKSQLRQIIREQIQRLNETPKEFSELKEGDKLKLTQRLNLNKDRTNIMEKGTYVVDSISVKLRTKKKEVGQYFNYTIPMTQWDEIKSHFK
jgi:hypothetical protein